MNILITGANGFIGSHLVDTLADQGHKVIAGIHDINNDKRYNLSIKTIECYYSQNFSIEKWLTKLSDIDVVINTVGIIKETVSQKFKLLHQDIPIALFKACEIASVKKVINISALGADDSAFSQFHLSKKIADNFLMTLNLNWVIVMPSIVYGPGSKSMNLFKSMAALPITPLINNGNQVIQPININDFCIAVNYLVTSTQTMRFKIAFVGSDIITIKDLFILLNKWLDIKSIRFINIPYPVMLLFSKIMNVIPGNPISSESIKMLQQGNIADVTPFVDYFGFTPENITESIQQVPAQQSERWYAKLLLIQPLLRLSIAFVWIVTGITSVFIYPIDSSYRLLEQMTINGQFAPIALYSAAVLDLFLGIAVLFNYQLKIVGLIQLLIIIAYTLLISIFLPEQWAHPFGPISKNIPLIVATMIMLILHDNQAR